jgi:hypothetical protein
MRTITPITCITPNHSFDRTSSQGGDFIPNILTARNQRLTQESWMKIQTEFEGMGATDRTSTSRTTPQVHNKIFSQLWKWKCNKDPMILCWKEEDIYRILSSSLFLSFFFSGWIVATLRCWMELNDHSAINSWIFWLEGVGQYQFIGTRDWAESIEPETGTITL